MIRILKESYTASQSLGLQRKQVQLSIDAIVKYARRHKLGDVADAITSIQSTLESEIDKIGSDDGSANFTINTGLSDRDAHLLMATEGIVVSDIVKARSDLEGMCKSLLEDLSISSSGSSPDVVTEDVTQVEEKPPAQTDKPVKPEVRTVPTVTLKRLNFSTADEVCKKILEKLVQGSDVIRGLSVGPFERLIAFISGGTVGNGRAKADVCVGDTDLCEVKYLARASSQCHRYSKTSVPTVVFVGLDKSKPWYFIIPGNSEPLDYFVSVDFDKNKQRNNMKLRPEIAEQVAKQTKEKVEPVSEAYEIVG